MCVADSGGSVHVYPVPLSLVSSLGMLLSQLVHDFNRVQPGILSNRSRNHFQRLRERIDDVLSLSAGLTSVVPQVAGKFQLDGATSSNYLVCLEASPHNHDCVI